MHAFIVSFKIYYRPILALLLFMSLHFCNACANTGWGLKPDNTLILSDFLSDREVVKKWDLSLCGQLNASGYNSILKGSKILESHSFGAGISYNISDGYLNRPVIGPEAHYAYEWYRHPKWNFKTELEYQLQFITKGIRSSNTHLKPVITGSLTDHWKLGLETGIGLMTESNSRDERTNRLHSLSWMLGVTCGYIFTY